MALAPGTKLGPYVIVESTGAGGMGEVYRARDTRLGRDVAVKVLPEHLTEKTSARQRFEREARAISSLQHPHICTLYDVGHQDGTDFLVMEYLEGQTLAERLADGALKTGQALKVGIEICEGLEKAHRTGVVHRDLKPGNIMLTATGAKLLDFGLAKPFATGARASFSALLTSTKNAAPESAKPVTAEGSLVGTCQYMSPEQLEGKEADERSDIFALGAVLHEMATGKRAFEGKTTASVIAAILEREPPAISTMQPSPPGLDRLVRACLAKDASERIQSVHDVKLHLEWIRDGIPEASAQLQKTERPTFWKVAAWSAAALLLLAVGALAARSVLREQRPVQMTRSSLLPPEGVTFNPYNFEISPDGTRLVFSATNADGKKSLWVRALSSTGIQQLIGTEGAGYPFWAPDNKRVGFFAEGKLKIADISNGTIQVLADANAGRGGTWNSSGVIVFAPEISGPLYRVSDQGGVPVAATEIPRKGSGQGHRWPSFLPDGRHFLYSVEWSGAGDQQANGIYIGSLDGEAPKLFSSELSGNVVYASGDLLYVKDRSLMAQPFDAGRLETTEAAVTIAEQEVPQDRSFSKSGFSVSNNGMLIFQSFADSSSVLSWYDATGKEIEARKLPMTGFGEPRVSPDGRFVAYDSDDGRNGKSYIQVQDLNRGVSTTLTDGGKEMDPAWTPGGKSITYISRVRGAVQGSVYEIPADGSGSPRLLLQGDQFSLLDWSPDGHLIFANFDIGFPRLEVYDRSSERLVDLGVRAAEPRFSPDGKWIAFTGIVIQRFPAGARIRVSDEGDSQPNWSHDGRHIFFISLDKKMMEADFDPEKGTVSVPRALFQTRIVAPNYSGTQYDVTRDGKFVINSLFAERASPLTLVTNWTALAKKGR